MADRDPRPRRSVTRWLLLAAGIVSAGGAFVAWVVSLIAWVGPCFDCPRTPDARAAIVAVSIAAVFLVLAAVSLPRQRKDLRVAWTRHVVVAYVKSFIAALAASIIAGIALSALWDSVWS